MGMSLVCSQRIESAAPARARGLGPRSSAPIRRAASDSDKLTCGTPEVDFSSCGRNGRMQAPTRQRLTEAAVRRFYRDGFRNVGLDQVLADVGISKTAFYKHFACKEDLVLAALEMKNDWLQAT